MVSSVFRTGANTYRWTLSTALLSNVDNVSASSFVHAAVAGTANSGTSGNSYIDVETGSAVASGQAFSLTGTVEAGGLSITSAGGTIGGGVGSVTVRADGWSADVTVYGFVAGCTYDMGLAANNTPSSDTPYLTVVSEGYNSSGVLGTITRTVYFTQAVRKAYPNHASLDEAVASSVMTVRVALSDYVYDDDNTGAGKSGTAPVAVFPAGWCVDTAGTGASTVAQSGLAVTNSSTVDYPKVIGHFAVAQREPVNGTQAIEVFAVQKFGQNGKPVARVSVTATGGTSANVESGSATAMTLSARGDLIPVYAVSLDLSTGAGYTRGELVTINFAAYPWVGDADSVLDATVDAGATTYALTPLYRTIMDPMIAVVDPVGGNDTTGVASATQATADASPCLTIAGAMTKIAAANNTAYSLNRLDGGQVQCKAGTYSWKGAHASSTTNGSFSIQPHSSTNRAGVVFDNYDTSRSQEAYQRFYNVTITRGSNIILVFAAAGNYLVMESVNFADTATQWYSGDANSAIDFLDCTYNNNHFSRGGSDGHARLHRNCTYTATTESGNSICGQARCVLGYSGSGGSKPLWKYQANAAGNNVVMAYMYHHSMTDGGLVNAATNAFTNCAIIGNVVERLGAAATPIGEIGDADCSNVVFWHNTFAGQRFNHENDIVAAYVNKTFTNWGAKYNSFNSRGDHRADVFDSDAAMVGTWSVGYSVGWSGNHCEGIAYDGDTDFWGIRSNGTGLGIGATAVAGYTADNSRGGADTGNGDYMPATGSVLLSRVPSGEAVLPFDLAGNAIPNDGTGDAGAIQKP